jgi:hypothetical protein
MQRELIVQICAASSDRVVVSMGEGKWVAGGLRGGLTSAPAVFESVIRDRLLWAEEGDQPSWSRICVGAVRGAWRWATAGGGPSTALGRGGSQVLVCIVARSRLTTRCRHSAGSTRTGRQRGGRPGPAGGRLMWVRAAIDAFMRQCFLWSLRPPGRSEHRGGAAAGRTAWRSAGRWSCCVPGGHRRAGFAERRGMRQTTTGGLE